MTHNAYYATVNTSHQQFDNIENSNFNVDRDENNTNADDTSNDNASIEFDEESYIKNLLENLANGNDDADTCVGDNVEINCDDVASKHATTTQGSYEILSEYERNILNKYLKEFDNDDDADKRTNDDDDFDDEDVKNDDDSIERDIVVNNDNLCVCDKLNANNSLSDTESPPQTSFLSHDHSQMSTITDQCHSSRQISLSKCIESNLTTNHNDNSNNQTVFDHNNNNNHNNNSNNHFNIRCNNSNSNNNNANDTNADHSRSQNRNANQGIFNSNISILVGVTSCVWGLVFLIVKNYVN